MCRHSVEAEAQGRARLVIVVGPTASGKTSLAIAIAEQAGTEIISADSQQVYRGMDIGTGKATAAELARVPHHLIDVITPADKMTAARFVELADAAIIDIDTRLASGDGDGPGVVVAGGTGLYVRALLLGLFAGPPASPEIRARLTAEVEASGGAALWRRLEAIDPASAARVDERDIIRLVRALEVYELTGVTMSEHQRRHDHRRVPWRYRARLIGLAPEREALYRRIDERVDQMVGAGLVEEVAGLRAAGYGPELRSQSAIGYAEIHDHLDGAISLAEAIRLIKRNSRRYARRQMSWYRGDDSVEWAQRQADVDLAGVGRYLGG